jgi:hypothetical protein
MFATTAEHEYAAPIQCITYDYSTLPIRGNIVFNPTNHRIPSKGFTIELISDGPYDCYTLTNCELELVEGELPSSEIAFTFTAEKEVITGP